MVIRESITINATMKKVWRMFTELTCWMEWNTVMRNVCSDEKCLTYGDNLKCSFRPFLFPIKITIKIEGVVPYKHIVWSAKKRGLSARHEFFFQEHEKGVLVISTETFTGFLTKASGLLLPVRKMRTLTRTFLGDLKKASEG